MRGFLGGVSISASVRAFLEWAVLVPASAAACPPHLLSQLHHHLLPGAPSTLGCGLRTPLKSARHAQLALSPLASLDLSLPCLFPVLSVCPPASLMSSL